MVSPLLGFHIPAGKSADKVAADLHLANRAYDGWLKVAFPVEIEGILIRKTTDRLWIMRRSHELASRLERFAKSEYKVRDFVQGKIIVGFIPETKQRAIRIG
jgi:hypothetical protein